MDLDHDEPHRGVLRSILLQRYLSVTNGPGSTHLQADQVNYAVGQ